MVISPGGSKIAYGYEATNGGRRVRRYKTEAASAAVRRVGGSQEGAPDFVSNLEARGAALVSGVHFLPR